MDPPVVGIRKSVVGWGYQVIKLRYEMGLLTVDQMKALAAGCPQYVQLVDQCPGETGRIKFDV